MTKVQCVYQYQSPGKLRGLNPFNQPVRAEFRPLNSHQHRSCNNGWVFNKTELFDFIICSQLIRQCQELGLARLTGITKSSPYSMSQFSIQADYLQRHTTGYVNV
ncbi:unnamed protein product, partial [Timema podura]|nr:unnamed protein product [Timema podura]